MNWWDRGSMGMLNDMMGGPAQGHPGLTFPSYPLDTPTRTPLLPQFRLKRCGLGRRVYLVEEYGSAHNLSLPESTLLQAVTNTQVSSRGRARLARDPVVCGLGQEPPPSAGSSCPGHRWLLREAHSGH